MRRVTNLIEWTFKREGSPYIACNERPAFFTSEDTKRYKFWSCQNVCEALIYLLDNIYIRFGTKLYRQIVGISMGTNCAPLVADFNARNKSLTAKLLQQGYRYHKLRKTFSKFYRRHYELVSKFNVGLKTLLHQGLSEPECYGDLVYKFKKIVGRADFSDQFRKIIVRYKRIGYNINIMRQSACLVFNPRLITLLPSLIACRWVGRQTQ